MRVLLVDDHALVRQGLRAVLATTDDCTVVGEAATGEEAVDRAAETAPDVVVMDLSMPGEGGVAATARLRTAMPAVRVLVLTTFSDDRRVRDALAAGATGYLLKDAAPEDVVAAVRAASATRRPSTRGWHGRSCPEPSRATTGPTCRRGSATCWSGSPAACRTGRSRRSWASRSAP